jgi:tetratricopeptide (TPR) repeat protein
MLDVNARALLGQELYRCGINRTPGTRTRTFSPDELVHLASPLGFEERARPGVQDGIHEFAGYPGTIDFVFEAAAPATEGLEGKEWLDAGRELVDAGLPQLVVESIEERGDPTATPQAAALYARALVKAGRSDEALDAALAALGDGPEHADLRGLARHDASDFACAHEEYAAAPPSHPDRSFLLAACLLQLDRHADAERLFAAEEGLRGWVGRLAVAVALRDEDALERVITELPAGPEAEMADGG